MEGQLVIRPIIQNNAYFCHPESILLSMITDSNRLLRLNAYNQILKARLNPTTTVRKFYIPQRDVIKFDCFSYTQMIDWDKFTITEPPCLQFILDDILRDYANSEQIIKVPDFLCHSQNTERFVHVVSESAVAVTDEQRLGHIFAKLDSRERYSQLESRQNLI